MEQTITAPELVNLLLQTRLDLYKARDSFDGTLKLYHDRLDTLIGIVDYYEKRNIEQVEELKKLKPEDKKE